MSTRGFNFLLEMFPNVDRTILSEMCSNIENDEAVDRIVESLLEKGGNESEVLQAVADANSVPVSASMQAEGLWTEPPLVDNTSSLVDLRCCTAGKCFQTTPQMKQQCSSHNLHNSMYAMPFSKPIPVSNSTQYCPVDQHAGYFLQPDFALRPQHTSMPFAYQDPSAARQQPFYSASFHPWPLPHSVHGYPQATETNAHQWPPCSHRPVPVEDEKQERPGFTICTEDANVTKNSYSGEKLQKSADVSVKTEQLQTVARIENNCNILEHPDRCGSAVSQKKVASSQAFPKTLIASHYLSLITILPHLDPAFIHKKCEEINGDVSELQKFVIEVLTRDNVDKNSCVSALEDKLVENSFSAVHLVEEKQEVVEVDEEGIEEDGVKEEGIEEDGAEEDGTEEDGTEEGGAEEDSTEEDGAEEDSAEEDGAEEDGAEEDGTEDDGIEEDGVEDDGVEQKGLEDEETADDDEQNVRERLMDSINVEVCVGGDGHSISQELHVASSSSVATHQGGVSKANVVEDVAVIPLAPIIEHPTETEDCNKRVDAAALLDASSDDGSCSFEILEHINDVLGESDDAVSPVPETDSNAVKLNDLPNENESAELSELVGAQQKVTSASDLSVSGASAVLRVIPCTISSCGEVSPRSSDDDLLIDLSSSNYDSPTNTASINLNVLTNHTMGSNQVICNTTGMIYEVDDDSDVESDDSVCFLGNVDSKNEFSSQNFGVTVVNSTDVPYAADPVEEVPNDTEQSAAQADVYQVNEDFPPELFEVDPDPGMETIDDFEIARMISEEDEAPINDPLENRIGSLLNFIPDADPSFLKDICERFGNDETKIFNFVQQTLDADKCPTFEDYLQRQETYAIMTESLGQITIPMFLDTYPRPFDYFYGSRRKDQSELAHEFGFLQRRYRNIPDEDLQEVLRKCDHNLTMCCKELDSWSGRTQHMRGDWECSVPVDIDMSFIHEVFFISNERDIREYLELESFRGNVLERAQFMEAKLECPICCDDELEIVQMSACTEGHLFCKECVKKNAETRIGDGLIKFPCLEDSCNAEFGTRTLESLLNPTLFTRMVQQKSLEEVESAHIENLVRCPFCEYAAILPPDLSVLVCENPECLKETCRYCREPNHIPLRCNEVEKEGETKMRTEIEDRMSEALIRKCNSCGKKFVKSDGCNKMTCPCGAIMCYLCRKTVTDYSHFNGMGGSEFHKCPLFSNDSKVHHEEVKSAATRAKADVTARNPDLELKNDPTKLLPSI